MSYNVIWEPWEGYFVQRYPLNWLTEKSTRTIYGKGAHSMYGREGHLYLESQCWEFQVGYHGLWVLWVEVHVSLCV